MATRANISSLPVNGAHASDATRTARAGRGGMLWRVMGKPWGLDLVDPLNEARAAYPKRSATLVDAGLRARHWARSLPCSYDIFLGHDPETLLAANVLACRLGRALGSLEAFLQGDYWISSQVGEHTLRKALLIVRSSADEVADIASLRASSLAGIELDVGILFPARGGDPCCTSLAALDGNS